MLTSAVVLAAAVLATPAQAQANGPIKIGVIAEAQAVAGSSIPLAAQLAADEINAAGGIDGRKIEIVSYDNHSSAAESVRAFQRAVNEDHVNAVIASYVSEVVLALEPWTGRLKTVMITPGAASDVITQNIAKDYEHLKYTFHGYSTSTSIADAACDAGKGSSDQRSEHEERGRHQRGRRLDHAARCRISEMPAADRAQGARSHPRLAGYHRLHADLQQDRGPEARRDDHRHLACRRAADGAVEAAGSADPDVRRVLAGVQFSFWQDTNGAVDGVLYQAFSGPDVAVTPKTLPFVAAFKKRFGNFPSYCGYTAYDEVYYLADAFKRAGSDDPDKLVEALEKTDYVGTIGRVQFKGKDTPYPHALKIGPGTITGLMLQWQNGKQVNLWPANVANGKLKFPNFIKLGAAN